MSAASSGRKAVPAAASEMEKEPLWVFAGVHVANPQWKQNDALGGRASARVWREVIGFCAWTRFVLEQQLIRRLCFFLYFFVVLISVRAACHDPLPALAPC